MICPYLINVSLLVGAILSWGIMWPLIEDRKGHWYPAGQSASSLHGIQGYRVRNKKDAKFLISSSDRTEDEGDVFSAMLLLCRSL